jgi:hypothetical protein
VTVMSVTVRKDDYSRGSMFILTLSSPSSAHSKYAVFHRDERDVTLT